MTLRTTQPKCRPDSAACWHVFEIQNKETSIVVNLSFQANRVSWSSIRCLCAKKYASLDISTKSQYQRRKIFAKQT